MEWLWQWTATTTASNPVTHHLCCSSRPVTPTVALMFGRPNGFVTFPIFKHYLHQSFGVRLSTEQAEELFKRFDKRGAHTHC